MFNNNHDGVVDIANEKDKRIKMSIETWDLGESLDQAINKAISSNETSLILVTYCTNLHRLIS